MMGGSHTELFRWPDAQLYLVDRDERALLQRGTFTLFLATHSSSPLLVAVEAIVADVQWPVGKDCEVTYRASGNTVHILTFVLQSLVYELVLVERDGYGDMHLAKLQDLLSLYTTFNLQGSVREVKTAEEEAGQYWTGMAGRLLESDDSHKGDDDSETLQLSLSGRYMQGGGRTSTSRTLDSPTISGAACVDASAVHRQRCVMKLNQARRISAVAKLFSKALMKGAISPQLYTLVAGSGDDRVDAQGKEVWPAVADVDLVAKVVEMVEKKATLREVVVVQRKKRDHVGSMSTWTLNEVGLNLLLKAVVAANMMTASATSTAPPPAAQHLFLSSPQDSTMADQQHHAPP